MIRFPVPAAELLRVPDGDTLVPSNRSAHLAALLTALGRARRGDATVGGHGQEAPRERRAYGP